MHFCKAGNSSTTKTGMLEMQDKCQGEKRKEGNSFGTDN